LPKPRQPAYTYTPERPGCLTAYVILLWIGAAFSILGGLLFTGLMMSDRNLIAVGCLGGPLIIALGVFYIFLGLGLWRLKNWARIVVMVLQGLGIAGTLLELCLLLYLYLSTSSMYGYELTTSNCASIASGMVGLVVSGYILYWFATNGLYFE